MAKKKEITDWAFKCTVPGCTGGFETAKGLATHKRMKHGAPIIRKQRITGTPLREDQLDLLVDDWGTKTIEEWAKHFNVSVETIKYNVNELRKVKNGDNLAYLCPEKTDTFKAFASKRGFEYKQRATKTKETT